MHRTFTSRSSRPRCHFDTTPHQAGMDIATFPCDSCRTILRPFSLGFLAQKTSSQPRRTGGRSRSYTYFFRPFREEYDHMAGRHIATTSHVNSQERAGLFETKPPSIIDRQNQTAVGRPRGQTITKRKTYVVPSCQEAKYTRTRRRSCNIACDGRA